MEKKELGWNPSRVLFGLSRIGYNTSSAICDIVANSFGADAKNINMIDDLEFFFHALPEEPRYNSSETTYRNAVEYLVQSNMLLKVRKTPTRLQLPLIKFISFVYPTSASNERGVEKVANNIVESFIEEFHK